MHSVWDSFLIAKAIRNTPPKYNHRLPDDRIEHSLRGAIYDPYVRQIMAEGVLKEWADDIPSWLQCPARNQLFEDKYFGWQQVFRNWFKGAGVRLSDDESDPGARTDDEVLCPYAWAKPTHALNCEIVWPEALDKSSYKEWLAAEVDEDNHNHDEDKDEDDIMGGRHPPHHEGPQLDTPEYAGAIAKRRLIEMLLAQAGVRLANTLNYLFANDGN